MEYAKVCTNFLIDRPYLLNHGFMQVLTRNREKKYRDNV